MPSTGISWRRSVKDDEVVRFAEVLNERGDAVEEGGFLCAGGDSSRSDITI